MLRSALICLILLAVVLVFPLIRPGNLIWLVPAFVLAPLAPWLCVRLNRVPLEEHGWSDLSGGLRGDVPRTVCVEPAMLVGHRWLQADVWLPFERTEGERFRSKGSAMLLATAVALTDDLAADETSVNGYTAAEIAEWENSLSIRPENIRVNSPRLDTARYCGFPGVVVRDGPGIRAWFVGGTALVNECHTVHDGVERLLTREDRHRLQALPVNALCYATAPVYDGSLGDVCFIGAVLPVARYSVSPDALTAAQNLHRMGVRVTLDRSDPWALENARAMGIEWPEDEGEAGAMVLRASNFGPTQPRRFDLPVIHLAEAVRQEKYQRMLCAVFGLALWPASTLNAYPWPFLIALTALCLTILISRGSRFPSPRVGSLRPFLLPLIPGFLLPLILWFFMERLAHMSGPAVGICLVVLESSVLAMWRLLLVKGRRGAQTAALGAVICVTALFGSILLMSAFGAISWIHFAFESIAGILTGVAVIVSHRLLAPPAEEGQDAAV